eukprot:TRINITY_DN3071_c0_g1_i6.p1 TRINITY_DN3071_c0_g1~~TRINITY_DN3071_c0_g1_i6.p1  ORF type:complete len:358 (-),score=9.33 TRINITY_DN3071_c0_g1_i6:62-1135(-)
MEQGLEQFLRLQAIQRKQQTSTYNTSASLLPRKSNGSRLNPQWIIRSWPKTFKVQQEYFLRTGTQKIIRLLFFNVDNETLAENVLITLIRERYNDGLLALGGLGFGAMIQQFGPLILNGESYEALYYGPYTRYDEDFSNDLVYTSLGGLNLAFSFGLLDVEFASKGRIGRILEIGAYLKPRGIEVNFGFGLDDQTALHIMESVITVLGDNGLSVIDFSGSHIHDYDIDGIKYSYIKSGDVIVFEDNFIRPLPHPLRKILPCSQNSTYFGLFSKDILSSLSNSNKDGTRENPGEFVKMVNRFARDDLETISAITYENDPSFKLALTKNDKSFIVVQEQTGEANISLYSVNLSLSLIHI